jgi:hypothetical protein
MNAPIQPGVQEEPAPINWIRDLLTIAGWFLLVGTPYVVMTYPLEFNNPWLRGLELLGKLAIPAGLWVLLGLPWMPSRLRTLRKWVGRLGVVALVFLLVFFTFIAWATWRLAPVLHGVTLLFAIALVALTLRRRWPRILLLAAAWLVPSVSSIHIVLAFRLPEGAASCARIYDEAPERWLWRTPYEDEGQGSWLPYDVEVDGERDLVLFTLKALMGGGGVVLMDRSSGEILDRLNFEELEGVEMGVPERIAMDRRTGHAWVMTLARSDHILVHLTYGDRKLKVVERVDMFAEPTDLVMDEDHDYLVVGFFPPDDVSGFALASYSLDEAHHMTRKKLHIFGLFGLLEDLVFAEDGRLIVTAPGGHIWTAHPVTLVMMKGAPSALGWVAAADGGDGIFVVDMLLSTLHKLSRPADREVASVSTGLAPRWIASDPAAGRVFVATYGGGQVEAYDTSTMARREVFRVGRLARGLAVDRASRTVWSASSCGIASFPYGEQ